jgi:twitching motility protein PilT
MEIKQLLEITLQNNASDLHILANSPPIIRVDGRLSVIGQEPKLTPEETKTLIFSLLSPGQKDLLLTNKELDFSFDFSQRARFRINAFFERGRLAAALRLIPFTIKTIEELNLPKVCHRFTQLKAGFILVTGPTGHGKSSTLAAIIEEINRTRKEHIITIEDPIEYVYSNKESIINQRELHHDTHSWMVALRSVLREDPDVVLIGEMRDYETIAAALTIAETGHLVFATLHTNSAAQTVDRIVDVFPEHQQAQVRMQLSNSLEAVFSQRLLPSISGGRLPAAEVLLATSAVKSTIREGKTHLIDNIIQTSQELGMMSLEKSLATWVRAGKVSQEIALSWSLRPEALMRLLRGERQ